MDAPQVRAIVIVDDEKSFTDLVGPLLGEYFACPVHTFAHPQQALAKMGEIHPGVVVTDFYMPGMSGVEFIRRVRLVAPEASCILITGHPFSIEDHEGTGLERLKAVLPKPLRWQQLAEVILKHWCDSRPPFYRK